MSTNNLLALINEATAELNAQYLVSMQNWIISTAEKIAKFKVENTALRRESPAIFYSDLFEIAGGKTWYNLIDGRNNAMRLEIVEKHCKQVIEKRNATIANKLKDFNINTVEKISTIYNQTGFEGVFKIETDMGVKTVEIRVIVAGGYNVQCIHNRTLITIR